MFNNSLFRINGYFTCFCVIFIILLLPLARGGTLLWPQGLSILLAGMLCIALALFNDLSKLANQSLWLLPWLVISGFIILQLIPFRAFDISGSDPFAMKTRISAMPGETISYWANFTLYWLVAWLVSNLGKRQIILLVISLGILLCFESIYGILAYMKDYERILGLWYVENYSRVVSGTFVNRNHYSIMFEVTTPVVLSLLFMPKLFNIKLILSFKICIGLLFLFLCTLAVFNARSRLGLLCYFFSISIWIILVSNKFNFSSGKHKLPLFVFSFFAMALLVGLWFGLEPIMIRFQSVGENFRYLFWDSAVQSFPKSYWLWGMGAGTLVDNFKVIAPIEIADKTLYQLHNDWLEFVLDFGIPAALVICAGFFIWFRKLNTMRYSVLQLGAISGIAAIAIHSFGDFGLQIPGVAILFWTMVGISMNKNLNSSKRYRRVKITKKHRQKDN